MSKITGKARVAQKAAKLNIRTGDTVVVISGKYRDRNQQRKVLRVVPSQGKVVVEGVNVVKDVQKATSAAVEAGIVEKTMPIDASNVMLVDPKSGKASRVRLVKGADGKRVRVSVKSGEPIS
jgi:large subunit ribosomal protein L24